MPTLNSTQLNTLANDLTNNDVAGFYAHLESYGDSYGRLGAAVTNNNTWQGQLANGFANAGAVNNSVDMEYDSTLWNTVNSQLAQAYLTAYNNNSGSTPDRSQIQTIHNTVYTNNGLDQDDWMPNKLLNDSNDPDALWADYLSNDGAGDLVDDAFDVVGAGAGIVFPPAFMVGALTDSDFLNKVRFADNFFNALKDMDGTARLDMAGDFGLGPVKDLLDLINSLPAIGGGLLGHLPDLPGLWGAVIPDWMSDALDRFHNAEAQASPLILDLSGTGVALSAFDADTTTTFFDVDGDGFAEQTAWVTADMGLLTRDLNSNGSIDNASELFGSSTVDGFALLSTLDSNNDYVINQYDSAWSDLRIWVDDNEDAITDSGELHTLASLDIKSIDLAGVTSSTSTVNGNPISHTSTFTYTNDTTGAIVDAWFVHDNVNSYYNEGYTLDVETLFLPTLRGFGTLPDLHIAMSLDGDLKDLVSGLASGFTLADLADPDTLDGQIEDILFRWAGVDDVDPGSRDININAQHLEFLEALFGETFYQHIGNTIPLVNAGHILENTWHNVFETLKAHILVQLGLDSLFEGPVTYDPSTGTLSGDLTLIETGIGDLEAVAPGTDTDAKAFWLAIADMIDHTRGIANLDVDEQGWLDDAVTTTTTIDWEDVVDLYEHSNPGLYYGGTSGADSYTGGTGDDELYGGDGADTLHGGAGNDHIVGENGNDTLYGDAGDDLLEDFVGSSIFYGGDGNDAIYGGSGSDELHGDAGGNSLYGSLGADTYVHGGGDDLITDTAGNDELLLGPGVEALDVVLTRISTGGSTSVFDDLLIKIADGGSIQIASHFAYGNDYRLETIVFDDTSTIDLTTFAAYQTMLTDGDDSYSPGINTGVTVNGLRGNDWIQTGSGNDIIDGGVGNDQLNGQTGDDTYLASPGFDTISDSGGSDDVIELPEGITAGDVHLLCHSTAANDLEITITGLGQIIVQGQFYYTGDNVIETIRFSDNSTIDLTAQDVEIVGTSGNDTLYDITAGASTTSIFDGREGDDSYVGAMGYDNIIYFGAGSDTANDSGGTETIRFRDGVTFEQLTFADTGTDDLTITQSGTGDNIVLQNHRDINPDYHFESLVMNDGFAMDLGDYANWHFVTANFNGDNNNAGSTDLVDTVIDDSSGHTLHGYDLDDVIAGMGGNDTLYGDNGNDQLRGGDGTDTLYGGDNDDILWGGDGADTLSGGTGADTFKFMAGESGSDTISDFSTAQDDVLDLVGLLTAFDPVTEAITDFVQITTSGSDSLLKVDVDGGGDNFVQIATLTGVTGLTDEASLLTNGHLLAA